jgi:myo-inositol catabolism protein IolC
MSHALIQIFEEHKATIVSVFECRMQFLDKCQNSGCGRLKFSDFKDLMCSLKYWQSSFKNHTREKTGILKAERLRDALLEVGMSFTIIFVFCLIIFMIGMRMRMGSL